MSTTTNGTTEVAVIEQHFTGLDTLPNIYKENTGLTQRATLSVRPKIDAFNKENLATAQVVDLNKWDADLNELAVKVKACMEKNSTRRKPQTQKMDAIKKLFTTDEAALEALLNELVAGRNKIAQILLNKSREEEKKKADLLAAQSDTIELKSRINARLNVAYTAYVTERQKSMRDKFYEQTAESMAAYMKQLADFKPDLPPGRFTIEMPSPTAYNGKEAIVGLVVDATRESWPGFKERFIAAMIETRKGLQEIEQNRLEELQKIADGDAAAAKAAEARKQQEDADARDKQQQEADDAVVAANIAAEAEKLDAQLTVEATADAGTKVASGTRVAKAYSISGKQGWIGIIQWFMANEFAKMTDVEVQKKFSFMEAPANKALNLGTVIENKHLEVVDAISTRTSKKA